MKFLVALTVLVILAATFLLSAVGAAPGVTYVDHDKVAAAIGKGGTLVTAPDLTVMGSHRDAAGRVEVHDKETDVIYMVDGQATFVTGGTVVGLTRDRRPCRCSPLVQRSSAIGELLCSQGDQAVGAVVITILTRLHPTADASSAGWLKTVPTAVTSPASAPAAIERCV
jgi:hypothetical protein